MATPKIRKLRATYQLWNNKLEFRRHERKNSLQVSFRLGLAQIETQKLAKVMAKQCSHHLFPVSDSEQDHWLHNPEAKELLQASTPNPILSIRNPSESFSFTENKFFSAFGIRSGVRAESTKIRVVTSIVLRGISDGRCFPISETKAAQRFVSYNAFPYMKLRALWKYR